jgi:hypothetical protein
MCRLRVEWDQCVGWHLNQLQREYTVRNPTCGHLQSLVSVCVCSICILYLSVIDWTELNWEKDEWFTFIILTHTYTFSVCCFVLIDWYMILLLLLVYEIVAQCEPHKDKDVIDVAVRIRSVCVCVCVCEREMRVSLHTRTFSLFLISWQHTQNCVDWFIWFSLSHSVSSW